MNFPLQGRNVLITGVSRRRGIGYAIARRFAADGAKIFIQHYRAHDEQQQWGGDDLAQVCAGIRAEQIAGALFGDLSADLSQPTSAAELIEVGAEALGRLDILICNHARTGQDGSIFDMTAETLDAHWTVNARSPLLLTRYFAEQFAPREAMRTQPGVQQIRVPQDEFSAGRVIWLTSGQITRPAAGRSLLCGLKICAGRADGHSS
ncbi:SDR family oxidoreductase [Renibacterium salmoninarum]|nr:SDR family oxidoreductase [Renibacterium salmoninarum]